MRNVLVLISLLTLLASDALVAGNWPLGDCSPYCLSSVAVSEGRLFIRTASFFWAIGERKPGN